MVGGWSGIVARTAFLPFHMLCVFTTPTLSLRRVWGRHITLSTPTLSSSIPHSVCFHHAHLSLRRVWGRQHITLSMQDLSVAFWLWSGRVLRFTLHPRLVLKPKPFCFCIPLLDYISIAVLSSDHSSSYHSSAHPSSSFGLSGPYHCSSYHQLRLGSNWDYQIWIISVFITNSRLGSNWDQLRDSDEVGTNDKFQCITSAYSRSSRTTGVGSSIVEGF